MGDAYPGSETHWLEVLDTDTTCEIGTRLYGASTTFTDAEECNEYCDANYPSTTYTDFWPNGNNWCNCYNHPNIPSGCPTRCVSVSCRGGAGRDGGGVRTFQKVQSAPAYSRMGNGACRDSSGEPSFDQYNLGACRTSWDAGDATVDCPEMVAACSAYCDELGSTCQYFQILPARGDCLVYSGAPARVCDPAYFMAEPHWEVFTKN